MSPLMKSNNIAARMGRWSASHWKTAVFGWIAFVLLAVVAGTMIGTKQIDQRDSNTGQAHRADQILKQAGFQADPQTEIVLVQSTTQTIQDAAFRATIADAIATVKPYAVDYKNFRSPLDHADQVTADGHAAMVEFDMRGTQKQAEKRIDAITTATGKIQARHPGFFVGQAGSISSGKALNDAFNSQVAKAGERSIPLTLVVLLVVFGSLVAAGIPLLLALSAVLATLGLVSIPSHLVPMDPNVSAVVLLVGLAVGVDYSLFYLKREREERAAGMGPRAALEAAAATSGRSVLISGLTVMVAMAGLLFARDRTYLSFGVATITVVAVAMLGSLTVLPAVLSRLGDKIEKGRIPFLHRLRRDGGENRFWSAILDPVLRHPVVSVVASAGALIVLALPVLHIHTSQTGLDALPKSIATVPTIDRLQQEFPGGATPALVAIKAPADSPAVMDAVKQQEEGDDAGLEATRRHGKENVPGGVGAGAVDRHNGLRKPKQRAVPSRARGVANRRRKARQWSLISINQRVAAYQSRTDSASRRSDANLRASVCTGLPVKQVPCRVIDCAVELRTVIET